LAKLVVNDLAPDIPISDIKGDKHWVGRRNIQLANVGQKTILSFYREATCAFCNYRIYQLSQQVEKLSNNGVRLINIFVSDSRNIERVFQRQFESMVMVSDPDRVFYKEYGIQKASHVDKIKAIVGRLFPLIRGNILLARSGAKIEADSRLLPADFLISPDGYIKKVYYGRDIGDHIPLKELLEFAVE